MFAACFARLDLIVQAKSGTGKTCVFTTIALDSLILENTVTQVFLLFVSWWNCSFIVLLYIKEMYITKYPLSCWQHNGLFPCHITLPFLPFKAIVHLKMTQKCLLITLLSEPVYESFFLCNAKEDV